uniref:O-acyltransferase WSD1-like n=1 Tax=Tanacetum cinerariifolium TaxID=118510 RepID=A0A6L2J6W0_TANCI|nr:O-acyltransferase WSD1-like [Tanacetum cinerariifolium]
MYIGIGEQVKKRTTKPMCHLLRETAVERYKAAKRDAKKAVAKAKDKAETRVSENEFGFMPGRSTIEAIHLLRSLMVKYREKQRDLHLAFLDLEKAYDSVLLEGLNHRLELWSEALEDNGLRVSREKTEYLRCDFCKDVTTHNEKVDIRIGDQILQPKDSFRYLGTVLEMKTISSKMKEGRLRWLRHVRRRPQQAPVRRVEALIVNGKRRRGIPKLRWEDRLKLDMKELLLSTINDVLFGVISLGLSRYLEDHSRTPLKEGLRITGAAMVNLRPSSGLQEITELMKNKSGSRWGNKFGMMLLPIYYHKNGSDPLQYLKRAKTMIDRKKLSLEAYLSYKIGYFVMKVLGAQFASLLNYRIVCNTTFTISNVVGPKEEFMIAGIPVTYIRATSTSMANAITMHMVSYAGKADMQILVAKELIPHPEKLAKCFEDALLGMKEAALKI